MLALGAVIRATGTITLRLIKTAMAKMLSHNDNAQLVAANQQPMDAGHNAV
jgi:hypothetical protein